MTRFRALAARSPFGYPEGQPQVVAGGIARCFSGLKLEFRLLMPVELVTRCVMNAAIWYTEGTDVGEYISAIAKTELAQISEDLTALRSKELKTAGDSLTTLLRTAPLLLEMEAGSRRDAALARFADDAEQCQHDADIAFRAVGTMDEQIRAVVIASTAIEATAADGERNRDRARRARRPAREALRARDRAARRQESAQRRP